MKDFKVYQTSGVLTNLVTNASDVRAEYEEISGLGVQFYSPITAPLISLTTDFKPVQSGSGDPAPDNVRPITGWRGANIYHSGEATSDPTTYLVSWQDDAGSVFGGTLTINEDGSGTLISKYRLVDGGNQTWTKVSNQDRLNFYFSWGSAEYNYSTPTILSSIYKSVSTSSASASDDNYVRIYESTGSRRCAVKDTANANKTATQFKALMSGVQFCALLSEANWVTYNITAQQISAFIGYNNIWADTGDVSVKYRVHY